MSQYQNNITKENKYLIHKRLKISTIWYYSQQENEVNSNPPTKWYRCPSNLEYLRRIYLHYLNCVKTTQHILLSLKVWLKATLIHCNSSSQTISFVTLLTNYQLFISTTMYSSLTTCWCTQEVKSPIFTRQMTCYVMLYFILTVVFCWNAKTIRIYSRISL